MSEKINSQEVKLSEEQLALIDSARQLIRLNSEQSETYGIDPQLRTKRGMFGYLASYLVAKARGQTMSAKYGSLIERNETLVTTTKVELKRLKVNETPWDSYGGATEYLEHRDETKVYNDNKTETLILFTEVIAHTGMGGMGDVGPVRRGTINLLEPLDPDTIATLQEDINEALAKKQN